MTERGILPAANAPVQVLTEAQVRSLVPQADALDAVREALIAHASGTVSNPHPWHLEVQAHDGSLRGEVHVKGAYVHGASHFAVKLATGFFANRAAGLPVSSGLSVVADAATGLPRVVAFDNGYLTDVRTGAAGALAADALSRPDSRRVALIGPGVQAAFQLRALLNVRNPTELLVYGTSRDRAVTVAAEARMSHPWQVRVTDRAEDAVRDADIVITTTPSREPHLRGEWLKPGAHVTAVGADMEGKRELHWSVLERAHVVAADDVEQCLRIGELQYATERSLLPTLRVVALGEVLAGRALGRAASADITVADLTGLGAQDAAVGNLLATRCGPARLNYTRG